MRLHCFFVFCFFPLFFVSFLICFLPSWCCFLLLLFFAGFFDLLFRSIRCVSPSCFCAAFAVWHCICNTLVILCLFALFLMFLTFFRTDMCVDIFVVFFSLFYLMCCFGRFRVFVTLFTLLPLCLALHMQCIGEESARWVLFCFFFVFVPPDLTVFFFSCCPPRVTRVKYGSFVPIWALPYLLPVSPHIISSHYTHPNHSRTSLSFLSCVCGFCSECVFYLRLCLCSCVLRAHFDSCVCLFVCICMLLC